MTPIHNRESDHRGSPPAISDTVHPPGTNGDDEDPHDVEQTPLSSVPLLSPFESRQSDREPLLISIWQWALVFFVPAISVAYLTLCYVVHYRVVPANVSTDITSEFIIAGVALAAVNGISNSSYGLVESIMVLVHRHCSLYYVTAFIAAVVVWAVSTLAPAALSIQPILIDGAVMAFSVGAIPPLSLPVMGGQTLLPSLFSPEPGYAAAIVWAEREIGLSYSFSVLNDSQGVYSGFVVPTPLVLNSTTNARWLTDVIGFNPYCTWATPVNLTATSLNFTMNSTQVPSTAVSVYLEEVDLQVTVPSSYFPVYNSFFVTSINVHDPTVTVFNYTTGNLPTDGAMVMSVIQCTSTSCTEDAIDIVALFVDFTDVPSMGFSSIGADYELGFLVCKPNITIETREIRTQGSMTLAVQPLADSASPYPRQGNLDWTQTSLLVAYSLSGLTTDSGPASSAWFGLGSATQADFIFGSDQMNSIPWSDVNYENTTMVLRALPPDQLAQGYTQMVKASMKPYVSGLLGTSYVPGCIASVQQIFVSSMPHVIASTILISLLFVTAVAAYFRRGKGDQFNLTNVAAVLADSELPEVVKRAKVDIISGRKHDQIRRRWQGTHDIGREVTRKLGNWKIP
ncbi:hypothetical protein J3R83DRAFT_8867 [Lanmaoa asiatica]|nr:hypothetical protein J3R83DRAFT_8867 [Lanmaoa asiatica]